MGKGTKIFSVMLACAVLGAPLMARADQGEANAWHQAGNGFEGHQIHLPPVGKVLDLTDDQIKQLKDIHQKQREAMKDLFKQIKANRAALNTLIINPTLDMNKVNDIQTQFKALQSQMVDNYLNNLLAIKKVLTPDQFTGYVVLTKEREMMRHFGPHEGFDRMQAHKHWGDKDNNTDKGVEAQMAQDQD